MDQNNPARFLDTAYNALKANPGATNQILQAAAQGAPVGLRGLAAAAAQQSQQEAQKSMAALQQQGPQPNIVQRLATQGIMSQMDTGLPIAPQMGAPEQTPPQMMAGGGLVAFAGGGNVLPPDVIDAIQSHFAEGGDVRGFAGGEEIMAILRGAADELPYGELGSFIEGPGATPRPMPADYGPMGSFIEGAPREAPSKLDMLKRLFASRKSPFMTDAQKDVLAKQLNWNMIEGSGEAFPSVPESVSRLAGKAKPAAEFLMGKVATPLAILSDPVLQAATKANVGLAKAAVGGKDAFAETPVEQAAYHFPELAGRGVDYLRGKFSSTDGEPAVSGTTPDELIDVADVDGRGKKIETWKPEAHDGHEVSPRQRVPVEAQKVSQEFKEAKKDVPSAAVTPASKSQGLGGLDQGREAVDYIKSLLGEKKLNPEISQKLADLEDKARTSTIIQSVLGGLAGGLSNPYGGRFALGSAALQALGGYQKGIGSEEDIQRKALDIERAYADQPAEMQTAAAKEYFDMMKEKARALSAERVAEGKALSREDLEWWKEQQRLLHPEVHGGGAYSGITTPVQEAQIVNMAIDNAEKNIAATNTTRSQKGLSALSDQERTAIYRQFKVPPQYWPTSGGLGGGPLGGAQPTGRSIIGGKLTGSSPQ